MPSRTKCSAFLVGAQSRLIQCGLVLLARDHEILGIISADSAVRQWAKEKNLNHISPDADYVSVLRQNTFDLLLSIDNPLILPSEALGLARKFSINFHDGPLPRYAGVNVTDWAILNQETSHGVSWHTISEQLDAGDVLKQSVFPVSARETALTLNAKCFEASIESFAELIDEVAEDRVVPVRQDLSERTYFGLWKRPEGNCTIDWSRNAEEIDALVRGLNHGSYESPLGLPKLYLGDRVVVVKEAEILDSKATSSLGTILYADADRLGVATAGWDVEVRALLSFEGSALSPQALLEESRLRIGDQLPRLVAERLERVSGVHKEIARHERFWAARLRNPGILEVPFKNKRHEGNKRGCLKARLSLSEAPFKRFGAQHGAGDVVLAASLLYFSRISGNASFDVDFQDEALRQKVTDCEGFFAPHVPLHAEVQYEKGFGDFLEVVERELGSVRSHGTYPKDLPLRDPSLRSTLTQQGERSVPIAFDRPKQLSDRVPRADCDLVIVIPDEGRECVWWYDEGFFDAATIANMQKQFATLWSEIGRIGSDLEQKIGALTLLSPDERQQVLVDWNATGVGYPRNVGLHKLIEQQAAQTPKLEALRFGDHSLSYEELNARANQVAHYLRTRGVGQDVLVGVCAERSIEMVIALLASMKAGGAYMPLDPEYPAERLRVILDEANPPIVLTQSHLLPLIPGTKAECICLDTDWEVVAGESIANLEIEVGGKDVAYAIFTSGSTGKPKGVLNVHEGIVNRLLWMQDAYLLRPGDRVLQKTPFSFDVSVWEFFWPLMFGATMVVAQPGGHRDPNHLVQLIQRERITTMHFVPSMLQMFLEADGLEECTSLTKVFCSGEALPYEVQKRFFERLDAELHNLYGPTEAAVDVTYWECKRNSDSKVVPIGRPIANTQIVILDGSQQPVPVGVAGELHIGGVNLARGYLNRPDLTSEKFVPNPFPELDTDRLYRTGDLARFLPDGNVEYLGRMDHQVKIRGFRIELGEIENALGAIPGVREAAVIAREDTPGDKRLVAYFSTVPTGEVQQEAVDIDSLRTHLSAILPEFMVPAAYVHLESLPLSPNGKLDRKALPAPKAGSYSTRSFEAPADDSELKIAEIWREVLQCTQVGREDNFFDLGGNSLHLMKVHGRLREAFNKDVAMVEMFRFTTIRTLANHLTKEEDSSAEEWIGRDVGARRVAGRRMRQLRKQVASELLERTIHERAAGD